MLLGLVVDVALVAVPAYPTPASLADTSQLTDSPVPLGAGNLTNWYGNTEFAFQNRTSLYAQTQGFHSGVDFLVPLNTAITSRVNRDGKVISINNVQLPYSTGPGNVVVDYGDYLVLYGHTAVNPPATAHVKSVGDTVHPGDLVALSGSDGTVDHLHREVIKKVCSDSRPGCVRTNPVPFFSSALHQLVATHKQSPASNFHPWPNCNQWLDEFDHPDITPGGPLYTGCTGNGSTGHPNASVDLAFVIDTTGSMGPYIDNVKTNATSLLNSMKVLYPDTRVGVVEFKDFPARSGDPYVYRDVQPFTTDTTAAKNAINSLGVGGGGDIPEARYCALMHTIKADRCANQGASTSMTPWRAGPTAKAIIYLTDAPALNPEPFTGFTGPTVIAAANAGGQILNGPPLASATPLSFLTPTVDAAEAGIVIFPVVVGSDPATTADSQPLAQGTGGQLFNALFADDVSKAITSAIGAISTEPSVSNDRLGQIVQYSGPVEPVQVTATAANLTGLAVARSFSKNGGPFEAGLPSGFTFTQTGSAGWTLAGRAQVGPAAYTVRVTATDANGQTGSTDIGIVVDPEDARVSYTSALFASTASATSSAANVTLSATIRDITAIPGDPAFDSNAGDIRNATVTFVDRDHGNATLCTAPIGLVSANDSRTGTATCSWAADLAGKDSAAYTVGTVISGFYVRDSAADNAIVRVGKPSSRSIVTGAGSLANQASAGMIGGTTGQQTDLAFTARYDELRRGLQGNAILLVRSNSHGYLVKADSISSFGVDRATSRATLDANATIYDITNLPTLQQVLSHPEQMLDNLEPLFLLLGGSQKPPVVDGSATLQITLTDRSGPGDRDSVGVTLWKESGGLWFASNWDGAGTLEQVLSAGKSVVR